MLKIKLKPNILSFLKDKINKIDDKVCGIYHLTHDNRVVYVGQSVNIKNRILSHINEKIKVFDDFSFIPCPQNLLNETETMHIYAHGPIFNKVFSLLESVSLQDYCNNKDIEYEEAPAKEKTHIMVKMVAKERLEAIRDKEGYASIEVVVDKLLAKLGNTKL